MTRPEYRGDDHYRQVARIYLAACDVFSGRGLRPAPNKMLADTFGVPKSTAERWVRVARRRGFLPPAVAIGQAGRPLDPPRWR